MPEVAPPTPIPSAGTRVTGGIDPARLARAIGAKLHAALDALGEVSVARVQEALSVPVTVTIGPKGGQHVERSKKGEPPRMDTEELDRHVAHEVIEGEGAIPLPFLRIESSRPSSPDAPRELEEELDRPILTPELVNLKHEARDFIARFLSDE